MLAAILQVAPEPLPIPFQPVKITKDLLHTRTDEFHKINQYRKITKIGSGKHGNVYLCRDDDGYDWAMKRIKRVNQQEKKMKSLKRNFQREAQRGNAVMDSALNSIRKEIEILKSCRHPNVVRLVEVIDDVKDNKVYLIQENLAAGPIEWKIDVHDRSRPLLTLPQTRRIMRDVILGLEYLHHKGIIHRDLKPYNVIYTEDRRSVKLIDFGVAHYIPPSTQPATPTPLSSRSKGRERVKSVEDQSIDASLFPASDLLKRVGTPSFLAPEIVWFHDDESESGTSFESTSPTSSRSPASFPIPKQRPPLTNAIDIWSLGITFYCLLFGHLPFEVPSGSFQNVHHSEYTIYNMICTKDWDVDNYMGADRVATGGRHPQDQAQESTLVICLLEQMLQKNPENRASLSDVKANPWILKDIYNPNEWLQLTSPEESKPTSTNWVKTAGIKFLKLIPSPR